MLEASRELESVERDMFYSNLVDIAKVADQPVAYFNDLKKFYNDSAAKTLGIDITKPTPKNPKLSFKDGAQVMKSRLKIKKKLMGHG